MSPFPRRERLVQVTRSLVLHAPGQLTRMLESPRFRDRAVLFQRLDDPEAARRAAYALPAADAGWPADLLLDRWARIGTPILEPAVAIVAPDEIWVGEQPLEVQVTLATVEIDPAPMATWEGDVAPGPPAREATLLVAPPGEDRLELATVRARVQVQQDERDTELVAERKVTIRSPVLQISADRRTLLVQDQAGLPAAGVSVQIGTATIETDRGGRIDLDRALPEGATVQVAGIGVRPEDGGAP